MVLAFLEIIDRKRVLEFVFHLVSCCSLFTAGVAPWWRWSLQFVVLRSHLAFFHNTSNEK